MNEHTLRIILRAMKAQRRQSLTAQRSKVFRVLDTHLAYALELLRAPRASCPSCCPPDSASAPFSERNVDTMSTEAKNIDCEAGALGCPPSMVPIANGMKLC